MDLYHDPGLEAGLRLAALRTEPGQDVILQGLDLAPSTLLAAYRAGLFPMGLGRHGHPPLGWWSPDPRGVLLAGDLRVTRSLRKVLGRFEITLDTAFDEVVAACADPSRDGRWITPAVQRAYRRLHTAGVAHSVECRQDGVLVGGLYGVGIGGLFCGESMFHRARDASKVALVALTRLLAVDDDPARVIDVQWRTDHLATLGVSTLPREAYLHLIDRAVQLPDAWTVDPNRRLRSISIR